MFSHIVLFFVGFLTISIKAQSAGTYGYVCRNKLCVKEVNSGLPGLNSLEKCKLNCAEYGSLWPHPTGPTSIDGGWRNFVLADLTINQTQTNPAAITELLTDATSVFRGYLEIEDHTEVQGHNSVVEPFVNIPIQVTLTVSDQAAVPVFTLRTDESYELAVSSNQTNIIVNITGPTFFGVRHGLETLSQLIAWDEANNAFAIVQSASIKDAPIYTYRGLMIDSSRNFISIPRIKSHIDGLSYNKLNIMHWHITDTHSFPMHVTGRDDMVKFGAYTSDKTYTVDQMKDIVAYARVRGVKVVIEFDAPAHTGNGWIWDESVPEDQRLAVCVNRKPWYDFCVEPPCGQLNIANPGLYDVLGDVYKTMMSVFDNDVFHMGGDEVDLRCYNTTKAITDYMTTNGWERNHDGFMALWDEFQTKAYGLWNDINPASDKLAILWTSELASERYITKYLPKEKYAIQIWTLKNDPVIPYLIENKYQVIISNYDSLYLDCGYHNWIEYSGFNWCSPYNTWQNIYENSPYKIYLAFSNETAADQALAEGLLLGAIAPLWSEQVDELAMESRFWPRGSALAERLWADPQSSGAGAAVTRMNRQRERLVARGIQADRIQPEYCYQNEEECVPEPREDPSTTSPDPQTTSPDPPISPDPSTTTNPSPTTPASGVSHHVTVFVLALCLLLTVA